MAQIRRIDTPPPRRSVPVAVPRTTSWSGNRTVVRLTKEIRRLHEAGARRAVETIVQIGERLRRIQAELEPGQWLRWLDEAVPYTRRTATNYIALAEWSRRAPAEFPRFASLGPSKLYLIAALPKDRRKALKPRRVHAIPGQGRRKPIADMTTVEVGRVIDGFTTTPAPREPIHRVVQAVHHRIAGLDAVTDTLVHRKSEVTPDQIDTLRTAIEDVVEKLDSAFG